eukprot:2319360-Ditylum_brightwellii.AAC.1
MMVASAEIRYMDALEMDGGVVMDTYPKYQMIPHGANKVVEFSNNKSVRSVSSIHSLDDAMLDQLFNE